MKKTSDEELIARYKETGDQNFLAAFYQRYSGMILGTSYKYLKNQDEMEDAAGNIYVELVTKVLSHEIQHPKSWLYKLTVNHCLMFLRKKKQNPHQELDVDKIEGQVMEFFTEQHLTEDYGVSEEQLMIAVDQLDESQKNAITLFHFENKSYAEIAKQMEWTLNNVKSYIQNGMANLKKQFKGKGKTN